MKQVFVSALPFLFVLTSAGLGWLVKGGDYSEILVGSVISAVFLVPVFFKLEIRLR